MKPTDMKVLAIGPGVWGRGDSVDEAMRNASKPTSYVMYIVHPDSYVNDWGDIVYPSEFPPKEIQRNGPLVRKKSAPVTQARETPEGSAA